MGLQHSSTSLMHSILFLIGFRVTVLAVKGNLILVPLKWCGIRPVMWSRSTEKMQTQFSTRPQKRMLLRWQQGSTQCPLQKRESWSIRSNRTMYSWRSSGELGEKVANWQYDIVWGTHCRVWELNFVPRTGQKSWAEKVQRTGPHQPAVWSFRGAPLIVQPQAQISFQNNHHPLLRLNNVKNLLHLLLSKARHLCSLHPQYMLSNHKHYF